MLGLLATLGIRLLQPKMDLHQHGLQELAQISHVLEVQRHVPKHQNVSVQMAIVVPSRKGVSHAMMATALQKMMYVIILEFVMVLRNALL